MFRERVSKDSVIYFVGKVEKKNANCCNNLKKFKSKGMRNIRLVWKPIASWFWVINDETLVIFVGARNRAWLETFPCLLWRSNVAKVLKRVFFFFFMQSCDFVPIFSNLLINSLFRTENFIVDRDSAILLTEIKLKKKWWKKSIRKNAHFQTVQHF